MHCAASYERDDRDVAVLFGLSGTGRRMSIDHPRTMLRAALAGKLDDVEMREDPVFRLGIKDAW